MLFISFKSLPGDQFDRYVKQREDEEHLKDESINDESTNKDTESIKNKAILCAFCQHAITDMTKVISVNGLHQHVFVNPHGMLFEIGCFKQCDGAMPASEPSLEFSWFPGHSWCVAVCGYCQHHLGWLFVSEHGSFYGIILNHLIFP